MNRTGKKQNTLDFYYRFNVLYLDSVNLYYQPDVAKQPSRSRKNNQYLTVIKSERKKRAPTHDTLRGLFHHVHSDSDDCAKKISINVITLSKQSHSDCI